MPKILDKKICRVLDANFNRAKEGLRVCEDICRFVYDNARQAGALKKMRHDLTGLIGDFDLKDIVSARDIQGDIGRASIRSEMRRRSVDDILFANLQRVKESVRVLEEFSKLSSEKNAKGFKALRYRVYLLERSFTQKL